ncbi:class I SAM-dependent methyltransferase [Saccharopolyspora sp. HNM0983]|uniref:Class I SAM-dependent methyltransferase n=1 Tax=Saccharopolyspora montiporae TaxID=2781240 RepID=A0A929B4E1_9PSEU|nr:class I SAM-dependent methyltransferase [Saccharopolyspora sp. HNM0983]MBE9372949.1 class I SAM-dependent methyltransferase [Saccharopolyspora sp. HNM0983]
MSDIPEVPTTAAETAEAARPFDELGARYEQAFAELPEQRAALDWLVRRLAPGAAVLDVGAGTGRPTAERLSAAGMQVLGIDVSAAMVDLARERVPGARFERADARTFDTPAGSWDAVCAFFALLIMSRPQLDACLRRLAAWVAPGGYLVFAAALADAADAEVDFLGRSIRVSSYPAEEYLQRLRAAGLRIEHTRIIRFAPDDPAAQPEPQLFCCASKPAAE